MILCPNKNKDLWIPMKGNTGPYVFYAATLACLLDSIFAMQQVTEKAKTASRKISGSFCRYSRWLSRKIGRAHV